MDPLTLLLRLPFLPLQGVIKLGELVGDQADRELHNPAAVRRRLEEAEEAVSSGEASDQDVAQMEREAIDRLGGRQMPAGTTGADPDAR
jgi:phosphate uptake regulator